MVANCVACSAFSPRPIAMPEGPMCRSCARFVQRSEEADLRDGPALAPALSDALIDALLADLVSAA